MVEDNLNIFRPANQIQRTFYSPAHQQQQAQATNKYTYGSPNRKSNILALHEQKKQQEE
jgi:hypothetical protein